MGRSGIPRLVLASSMVVYGEGAYDCRRHGRVRPAPRSPDDLSAGRFEPRCPDCGQELTTATVAESAPLDPRNAYAASKVAQEHLAATWARMTGGSAVALRYHNVYGPRMPRDTPYSGVAAIFRSALEGGRAPEVFEDGGQRRDFVHVHDVAQANLRALGAGDPGTVRGVQRRQRRAAHGRPDGRGARRCIRWPATRGDRQVPARRRAPYRGFPGGRGTRARVPRGGELRHGNGRVRPGAAAGTRQTSSIAARGPASGQPCCRAYTGCSGCGA